MVVRAARYTAETTAALELRRRVFCGEQGVSLEAEQDGLDAEAIHIVAIDDGRRVVGTCRLVLDGETARLGRMAVEPAQRGRGVGRAVLDGAERRARLAGATRMALHAQVSAASLYAQAGYAPYGDAFVEEGLDHISMEKMLA